MMPRLFLSATHKSSGKTTVSIGLCAALRARGRIVQPFKKGPDFIDPLWLSQAADRPCRNLDHHTMGDAALRAFFRRHAGSADIALIEGNKGLYDGVDPEGRDCGAALAELLKAPVLLIVDATGMTRGIAPLLIGYRQFAPDLPIAGVLLNKVGGARHEAKLRRAVEHYTDLPVLGALARDPTLEICERHLGLIPANEHGQADERIAAIAARVAAAVDLDWIEAIAASAPPLPAPSLSVAPSPAGQAARGRAAVAPRPGGRRRRLGFARDRAFGFYYQDDLDAFATAGVELVPFDTLVDRHLPPNLDGLFLGGGFPESHLAALEANHELRLEIATQALRGLPIYAECGGLMYLSRSLTHQGRRYAMVGALAADAVMGARPQGKGYVELRETPDAPWPSAGHGATLPAHEFHYGRLENVCPNTRFAYEVMRGHGITGRHDGIVSANILASFAHLRGVGADPWPARFAAFLARPGSDPNSADGSLLRRGRSEAPPQSSPSPIHWNAESSCLSSPEPVEAH